MSGQRLYSNPIGLFEFQARDTARCILRENNLGVWDPGLGKTHLALATASVLLEDNAIDHAIFLVEKNKIDEWVDDFATFTELDPCVFYGPKRKLDLSRPVILSTYVTFRDSLVNTHPSDNRVLWPTEIMEKFDGKRLLMVFDEAALFGGSQTSKTYKTYDMAVRRWRESAKVRTLALTATPLQRSPENYYNIVALMCPSMVPSRHQWESTYVTAKNDFGKPTGFCDLDQFEESLRTIMLRKRKTDDDVRDQFPKLVEKFVHVKLDPAHLAAYHSLDDFIEENPSDALPAFRVLNAFVCHPRSILGTEWKLAQEWISIYGPQKIAKLSSAKARAVMHDVASIMSSDDRGGIIVFAYSVSALTAFAADLRRERPEIAFVEYHGGQGDAANRHAKEAFRAGDARLILCSSKAERGVNLPEGHYIRNLDVPEFHSSYLQRLNRGSRIGSNIDGTLSVKTYIASETIERITVRMWNRRNQWSDTMQDSDVIDDDNFTSALDRIAAIRRQEREEAA